MKRGKASREGGIRVDVTKDSREIAVEKLSKLVTKYLEKGKILKGWKNAA